MLIILYELTADKMGREKVAGGFWLLKVQNFPFYNCGGCYYAVRK